MNSKSRKSIAEYYNHDAFSYALNRWEKNDVARANYAMTRDALLFALSPKATDNILEIGCGAGTWTALVSKLCNRLVALDISENMVRVARSAISADNVDFRCDDFMGGSPLGTFDKIFSVRVFEHFDKQEYAVQKILELLKPGGYAVIVTKTRPSVWSGRTTINRNLNRLFRRDRQVAGDASHDAKFWLNPVSPWYMKRLFKSKGFREIKLIPVILRPPIFTEGENEYPLISPPNDKKLLDWFIQYSKKVRESTNGKILMASIFLTESYLIQAKREA